MAASAEAIAAKAAEVEESEEKTTKARSFDQPGVRFSIPELRSEELDRSNTTKESFRQHVETALVTLRALSDLPDNQIVEFRKKLKFGEWEKKNKHTFEVLVKWMEQIATGRGGGGSSAREAELRSALDKAMAEIAALKGGKVTK